MKPSLESRSERFEQRFVSRQLLARVFHVLSAIPAEVVDDLLDDPAFHLSEDNYAPGKGRSVWMASPTVGSSGSRSVVLKPRLADCDEVFAFWVIAHEFAHAHLRNGGWGDIRDPEHAADALATSWGFPRPI